MHICTLLATWSAQYISNLSEIDETNEDDIISTSEAEITVSPFVSQLELHNTVSSLYEK